ncbi:MAG: FBP domain-containing protein [Archangium sp.]
MHKLDSEQALIATFRTRDQKLVELPADLKFPLIVRDLFTWAHPAGGRLYLLFSPEKGLPTGIVFDSNGGSGAQVPQMCSWCHSPVQGSPVAMLVTTNGSKKRVGVLVCGDLACRRHVEDDCNRAGRNVQDALKVLVSRVAAFATDALGIDLERR